MSEKFKIKRALIIPGVAALDLLSIDHIMRGETMERREVVRYVRLGVTYGPDFIREIGVGGRREKSGFLTCGVFTHTSLGEDENDIVAGYVRAAYPVDGPDLEFQGIRVSIRTVDDGTAQRDGSFWYSPLTVNWTVWSA